MMLVHRRRSPGPRVAAALAVWTLGIRLASGGDPASDPGRARREARIAAAARTAGLQSDTFGLMAVDLASGAILASHRADAAVRPASNMKLVVAATALARLGVEAEFRTELLAAGTIRGDVLEGDLVIVGGGDPTHSSRYEDGGVEAVLAQWCDAVVMSGIRSIRGGLRVDDMLFDDVREAPGWSADSLGKTYAAPVGALSFNESCIAVRVTPGPRPGSPGRIALEPPCQGVSIANRTVTVAGRGRTIVVGRPGGQSTIRVSGRIGTSAKGASYAVPVPDPGLAYGNALAAALEARGIGIRDGVARGRAPAGAVRLRARSIPLPRTFPSLLKDSQNLHGDVLLKLLGARIEGKGSFAAGAGVVLGYLKELGVAIDALRVDDGSGLSYDNRMSPEAIVAVLRAVHRAPYFLAFREAMATGGVDGTLKRRFTSAPLRGHLFGKTGSLTRVSALSGFILLPGQTPIAFSILCDPARRGTWSARRFEEEVCRILIAP
ncbi:MAG: D-alanyl-D-alanine carboxypeptidase/D-alanyl-D-alanine-endopeptidase [Planctomycetes bacterium]|nr:D-alanyl-D-alanine carboxypeptidase/D-alanyl-D-alanine-endopeptidase [Planctomycetota bacterium]